MSICEEAILQALDPQETVDLLRELVAVPSMVGAEGALAQIIGNWMQSIGVDVEYQPVTEYRQNVIGRVDFPRPGPCLMFNGHLDTVAPSDGWTTDPFDPTVRDNRLYGLGALDMKAGIAASLSVMKAACRCAEHLSGSLLFSGVIDEEGYSAGARALLERGLDDVDGIIIGEPCGQGPGNPVPTLTAGKVLYRLTVLGRQAHGFMPQDGVNAVEQAARIVAALGDLPQIEHAELGTGPVCTLKMSGGFEDYAVVVPDACEVIISRMIVPGEDRKTSAEDMERLVASLDLDARVKVEMVPPYYVPLESNTLDRLFRVFDEAHIRECGTSATYGPSVIISDASVFYGEGAIPTVVFGPSGGGIHQRDEFVDLGSVAECARLYARLVAGFLMGSAS